MVERKRRKPLVKAAKEIGDLDIDEAYRKVSKLLEESGLQKKQIAECIKKTRQMLHVALNCKDYPYILMDVLECLGYEVSIVIKTKIKTPEGED